MRFLLDENVPFALRGALIECGHDVLHVAQTDGQASDEDVLALAVRDQRVLVTFDSDFGTLIFYERRAAPPGLVYLRAKPDGASQTMARLVAALDHDHVELQDRYTVIDQEGGVRVLPLR